MPSPTSHTPRSIALIGAGPRGTSLIERIGANLGDRTLVEPGFALDIHVIDDAPSGAGKIWRTDQTRELCMNTLADAVTLFTEPSSTIDGPVIEGPTLYEWCLLVLRASLESLPNSPLLAAAEARLEGTLPSHIAAFEHHRERPGLAADYRAELEAMRPESHPSRALYGDYLSWCYDRAVAELPAGARVIRHAARAEAIERVARSTAGATTATAAAEAANTGTANAANTAGAEKIHLSDGTSITVDSVIVATGWLPRTSPPAERELSEAVTGRPELTWVRPESPIEQDLSGVAPGSHAIVRGLGMGFFDTMALLTIGRGGNFEPDEGAPGGLRYRASGNEPVLHVTSRRGIPFRAKTLYGSLPPRAEQRFLKAVDWSALPRPINFDHEVWPRIVADAAYDHYAALHRMRPEAFAGEYAELEGAIRSTLDELLDPAVRLSIQQRSDQGDEQFSARAGAAAWLAAVPQRFDDAVRRIVPEATERFDLLFDMTPTARSFTGPKDYDAWVRERVADDLTEAELGHDSVRKAGLWSFASARGFVSRIGTFGAFDAESRASGFATLMAVGGLVGSGPPAFRNRQLLALIDAGLVHFIGPEALLEVRPEGFVARSPRVPGSEVTASTLIDAWMHFHDVTETADPLVGSLARAGRARAFHVASREGGSLPTGGLDIDPATGLLIGAHGEIDPAVHFAGIPVDEAIHDTIISPMPGTDPTMLRETDRVARSALRIATLEHMENTL